MNSTANRYSCRLPSTSLMLFLPALLFFVLGTGIFALAAGSKKPDHTLTVPIREGMEDDKVYERAQGYWRPQDRTHIKYPLVAYISEGRLLVLDAGNRANIDAACDGQRIFVRILNEDEYRGAIGDEYPLERDGTFQEIQGAYDHDRLTIMLSDSGGKIHAAVKLIPSLIIPTVNHIHGDMDGKRGQGYWMPEENTAIQHPLVAYIGNKLVLYAGDPHDINVVCHGAYKFVRIMGSKEYRQSIGEDYLEARNGKFQNIRKALKDDRLKIRLLGSEGQLHADLVLIHLLITPVSFTGMDYKRAHGYWVPKEMQGVRPPVLVYFGPEEDSPMRLEYENVKGLDKKKEDLSVLEVVGNRRRWFVRISKEEAYENVTGEKYPSSAGSFPTITNEGYKGDKITLYIHVDMQGVGVNLVVDGEKAKEAKKKKAEVPDDHENSATMPR